MPIHGIYICMQTHTATCNDTDSLSILCSFHIGDCVDPSVYAAGLELGYKVFDYARDELDLALSVMDIGGGFPAGDNKESVAAFEQAASVINESAEKVFAAYPGVRLIAEPGRFFAQRTTCSFAQVIGKRHISVEDRQVRTAWSKTSYHCAHITAM